jgi:hypothetical protein
MFLQYYHKFYHCCGTECCMHLKVGHTAASFPGVDRKLHARVIRFCDLECLSLALCWFFFSNLDIFQVVGESGMFNPYHVAYVYNDCTSAESYWVACGLRPDQNYSCVIFKSIYFLSVCIILCDLCTHSHLNSSNATMPVGGRKILETTRSDLNVRLQVSRFLLDEQHLIFLMWEINMILR